MYIITHSSYAISYINVLNDLCTKRPYTFPHLYNATPYYNTNATSKNNRPINIRKHVCSN